MDRSVLRWLVKKITRKGITHVKSENMPIFQRNFETIERLDSYKEDQQLHLIIQLTLFLGGGEGRGDLLPPLSSELFI